METTCLEGRWIFHSLRFLNPRLVGLVVHVRAQTEGMGLIQGLLQESWHATNQAMLSDCITPSDLKVYD